MREAADVDVAARALSRGCAASVGGEEFPVILLDVGVAVLPRREHEFDVSLEIIVRVVAVLRDERSDEHFRKLEVERVFPCTQELMIVNAATRANRSEE